MNIDKRTRDFLVYIELRKYIDTDIPELKDKLTKEDYKWMIEYLENRLEYYTSKEGQKEIAK